MRTILLQRCFPDFPVKELPQDSLFQTMMEDTSYQHNECPSFALEDKSQIWMSINRLNPADREPGAPRFNVFYEDTHSGETVCVYSGDDYAMTMSRIMHLDELTEQHGDMPAARVATIWS